jgi:hypothetical protein
MLIIIVGTTWLFLCIVRFMEGIAKIYRSMVETNRTVSLGMARSVAPKSPSHISGGIQSFLPSLLENRDKLDSTFWFGVAFVGVHFQCILPLEVIKPCEIIIQKMDSPMIALFPQTAASYKSQLRIAAHSPMRTVFGITGLTVREPAQVPHDFLATKNHRWKVRSLRVPVLTNPCLLVTDGDSLEPLTDADVHVVESSRPYFAKIYKMKKSRQQLTKRSYFFGNKTAIVDAHHSHGDRQIVFAPQEVGKIHQLDEPKKTVSIPERIDGVSICPIMEEKVEAYSAIASAVASNSRQSLARRFFEERNSVMPSGIRGEKSIMQHGPKKEHSKAIEGSLISSSVSVIPQVAPAPLEIIAVPQEPSAPNLQPSTSLPEIEETLLSETTVDESEPISCSRSTTSTTDATHNRSELLEAADIANEAIQRPLDIRTRSSERTSTYGTGWKVSGKSATGRVKMQGAYIPLYHNTRTTHILGFDTYPLDSTNLPLREATVHQAAPDSVSTGDVLGTPHTAVQDCAPCSDGVDITFDVISPLPHRYHRHETVMTKRMPTILEPLQVFRVPFVMPGLTPEAPDFRPLQVGRNDKLTAQKRKPLSGIGSRKEDHYAKRSHLAILPGTFAVRSISNGVSDNVQHKKSDETLRPTDNPKGTFILDLARSEYSDLAAKMGYHPKDAHGNPGRHVITSQYASTNVQHTNETSNPRRVVAPVESYTNSGYSPSGNATKNPLSRFERRLKRYQGH